MNRPSALQAVSILALLGGAAGATPPPHPQQPPAAAIPAPSLPEQEVVVTGVRDIVVNGRARHCHRVPHDPLDAVNATPPDSGRRQMEIVPVGNGKFAIQPQEEPITGPVFWARTGTGIDQYVFRAPADGSPLCIGAKGPAPEGWGQLRRIVDAAPYRGKRVRFTAWVATGGARLVRFWLAAGKGMQKLTNGGNTDNQPWGGNHGWTPVLLEIGPISAEADHISYGFLLWGDGDVWVYHPKLEIVADTPAEPHPRDIAIIGRDRR